MHVTKSTAEKLKAAGYPQPKGSNRGVWYKDGWDEASPDLVIHGSHWSNRDDTTYAPDVVELLKVMSGKCLLSHTNGRWEAYVEYPKRVNFYGDDPAESLAEAYLFINKQL